MRITGVHLPGFGRLCDFSCEPAAGLNIIFGDNEAGKSTLQQAIAALLYGFYDNDRARAEETARHDRFRPWAAVPFRGSLEYELDDGRRFEVRRDFSTPDIVTQVIDTALGIDISPQFGRGRHGNVPFARRHLGMSRAVFQSCALISQGEIFEIQRASPSEIGDAIAALADSSRRDVSAARAIERLDTALARIGSDRARTAELPVAREKAARARTELEATAAARRSLAEKAADLERLQSHLQQVAGRVLRTRYLMHAASAAQLRQRLEQVVTATAALDEAARRADALKDYASLTADLRDRIIALEGQVAASRASVGRLEEQHQAAAAALTPDARLEYESLAVSVGHLTDGQVRELEAAAFTPAGRGGLGALLGALLRAAIALARGIIGLMARRRCQPAEPRSAPVATREEAVAIMERHRRYLALRPLVERAADAERQLEAERAACAITETRLQSALSAAGIQVSSLSAAVQVFHAACQKREEYLEAARTAEEERQRIALLLRDSSRADLEQRLAEHDREAARILGARPSLQGSESRKAPEQLARELEEIQEDERRTSTAATALSEEVRLTLERYRPRAEIEEEVAYWERESAKLARARAALQMAKATIEEAMTQVYRDFAPAVNSFLSEGVEAVTGGRYTRAHVDPSTLRVSLLVPETGLVVTDPPVSHGTRTLIYVLMRIGLAQHMSSIGESVPLILDDPFVDVDEERLPRMLDFLAGLSGRMQIFLFTKDRQVLRWFDSAAGTGHRRVHLLGAVPAPGL